MPAVLGVVVVVCLVVLGTRFADTSGPFGDRVSQLFGGGEAAAAQEAAVDDTRTRELVLSQANQFMIRINTYGPADLDEQDKLPGYVSRVKEVITPKLDVEFEKSVTYAEQSVAQAGLARTVVLYASGADTIESDLATVLVTGAISQSYPDPAKEGRIEYEPQLFRYEVRLVKTGGTWLVDDFTPVRGEVEGEPTDPAAVPTEQPTAPATVPPSDDAAAQVTQSYADIVARREAAVTTALEALDACGFPRSAPAGDTACADALAGLGDAARTVVTSLQGAANPTSKVFVGAPPATIADLVDATSAAAGSVLSAVDGVRPACLTTDSTACSDQRTAVTSANTELLTALGSWESLR